MNVCNLSVEKQRKLEEALLFSGQFKDALKSLMDWLGKMEAGLDDKMPVHGDLDTVIGLVEKHKNFEEELNGRTEQVRNPPTIRHPLVFRSFQEFFGFLA